MDHYNELMEKLKGISPEELTGMIEVLTSVRGEKLAEKPVHPTVHAAADHTGANRAVQEYQLICKVLMDLGVPQHIKGYKYLQTALSLVVNDEEAIGAITKVLYPQVAKKHNTKSSRVERAIRHAIERTWEDGNPQMAAKYFGSRGVNPLKGKPTNSAFLANVGNYVRDVLDGKRVE